MAYVFFIIGGVILLGVYLTLLSDIMKDAERRGENGWLVALFVADQFPRNLFLWRRYRPDVLPRFRDDDTYPDPPGASINEFVEHEEKTDEKD